MKYTYGIVVVTYNRLKLLDECLDHIKRQTVPAEKVVVVDNGSSDGTKEFLDDNYSGDDKFIIIHEKENLGGAGGFHRGIETAVKEDINWIFIIDDDAIIDFDCMEKMNPIAKENKTRAYACMVMRDNKVDISHRKNLKEDIPKEKYECKEFKCDLASFCGLMLERTLVEEIGFPLKEYFIWFDDSEYSMRIRKKTDIIVCSEAKLNHKTGNDKTAKKELFSWKSYYGNRNSVDAYRRHHLYYLMLRQIVAILKSIHNCNLNIRSNSEYIKKKEMLQTALKDGLKGKLGKNPLYLPK